VYRCNQSERSSDPRCDRELTGRVDKLGYRTPKETAPAKGGKLTPSLVGFTCAGSGRHDLKTRQSSLSEKSGAQIEAIYH
jgi:hypothetical protein